MSAAKMAANFRLEITERSSFAGPITRTGRHQKSIDFYTAEWNRPSTVTWTIQTTVEHHQSASRSGAPASSTISPREIPDFASSMR
jgi:hypothetical protein